MSKATHSIHLKSLSSLLLVTLLLSGCGNDDESTEPGSLAFSSDVYSVMENAGNVILQVVRVDDGFTGVTTVNIAEAGDTVHGPFSFANNGASAASSTSASRSSSSLACTADASIWNRSTRSLIFFFFAYRLR